jgi:hypothetical protein
MTKKNKKKWQLKFKWEKRSQQRGKDRMSQAADIGNIKEL